MTTRIADLLDLPAVSQAFGVDAEFITAYANDASQRSYYKVIEIPKRGRNRRDQVRVVHAAKAEPLRQVHRMIALTIRRSTNFQDHVQGFLPKRSIRTNAAIHLGARRVLHADLSNFFDTITIDQVRGAFAALHAVPAIAMLLARASTIDGFLRQGTRCSPAIANLVCRNLDADLLMLATSTGARYSRYADDLTFSGDEVPTSEAIDAVVRQHGFALRERCYTQHRGRGQYVTGLTVSDSKQPRLPRRMKRQMRLVLHYVEKYGVDAHLEKTQGKRGFSTQRALEGALRFFHSIEPTLTKKLREQFRRGLEISYRSRPRDEPDDDDYNDAPEY